MLRGILLFCAGYSLMRKVQQLLCMQKKHLVQASRRRQLAPQAPSASSYCSLSVVLLSSEISPARFMWMKRLCSGMGVCR